MSDPEKYASFVDAFLSDEGSFVSLEESHEDSFVSLDSFSDTSSEGSDHEEKTEDFTTQGGHAEHFKPVAGGFVRKETTLGEAELYLRAKRDDSFASLLEILPETKEIDTGDPAVVTMKNLTAGFSPDNRTVTDIKLGHKTFSMRVNKVRKGRNDFVKKLKTGMVDAVIDRDFRAVEGHTAKERYQAAKHTEETLKNALAAYRGDIGEIVDELRKIRAALAAAPVAIYGHSLLVVLGSSGGEPKFTVKLIDVGNHLLEREIGGHHLLARAYRELRVNTDVGMAELIELVESML